MRCHCWNSDAVFFSNKNSVQLLIMKVTLHFLHTSQVFSSSHCNEWTRFHLGPDGLLHYIHDFITKDKSEFCVDSYEEEEGTDSQYNPGDYDYYVRDLERNTEKVGRFKSNFLS